MCRARVPHQVKTGPVRQHDVAHQGVERLLLQRASARLCIARRDDGVTVLLQRPPHQRNEERIVVDDQNASHDATPSIAAARVVIVD
jgi:hypothetical protein